MKRNISYLLPQFTLRCLKHQFKKIAFFIDKSGNGTVLCKGLQSPWIISQYFLLSWLSERLSKFSFRRCPIFHSFSAQFLYLTIFRWLVFIFFVRLFVCLFWPLTYESVKDKKGNQTVLWLYIPDGFAKNHFENVSLEGQFKFLPPFL